MNKRISIILITALVLMLSACGASETVPISDEAVGAIFVNDEESLGEAEKIYAVFEENNYTFNLDAAWVYYFNADKDTAYAGSHNFTAMTFGANLDSGGVGAEGTAAWLYKEDSSNALTACYLFRDEDGVYFETANPFDHIQIQPEGAAATGDDYSCAVTFEVRQPTAIFEMIRYDTVGTVLDSTKFSPEQVEDYQKFTLSAEVAYVEIVCYGTDGETLEVLKVTSENPKAAICYEAGGQMLSSKLLRFLWE